MTGIKATLGVLAISLSIASGNAMAANSMQSKGAKGSLIVNTGSTAKKESASSLFGGYTPMQTMSAEDLEDMLHDCIAHKPLGLGISDCIAAWDQSEL